MTTLWRWAGARLAEFWRYAAPRFASVGVGILLWEVAGRWLNFRFMPPFSAVAWASWQFIVTGEIVEHLLVSLTSLLAGYGLGAAIGVAVGALMGRYRRVEHLLDIFVSTLLASPSLIYVPVLFALFGVSRLSQIVLIMLYVLQVTIPNTMSGVRSVRPSLIDMAVVFGAGRWQLFRSILLPGAMPLILSGLRISMGRAFKGMINGEMLIAVVGLGAAITRYGSRFDIEKVLGILLIVVTLAVLASTGLHVIERRATYWLSDST